jgi:23S rRNA (adenine1618-N6)-methyltransferase
MVNKYGNLSIDFHSNEAVLALNKALLKYYYNIDWDIPKKYLCPPIPGRVDYIHYISDLLPKNLSNIKALDIGVGANCIYPLVGNSIYNWEFVGSDIDDISIQNANNIIKKNKLEDKITIIKQTSKDDIFKNIIQKDDKFVFSMCNPPFHSSKKEAKEGTKRKLLNLSKGKNTKLTLNFGGQANELWYEGGELEFITKMIKQSVVYKNNILWFTTLVSKKENLTNIYKELEKVKPLEIKTVDMKQGNKITRFVAWRFMTIL